MNNKKEATIYDIAEKLNISPATVSRGLKNHPAISEKTKKRIGITAEKMGYRSNNFARSLREQRTNTIGVLVHELNSNFITCVLAGIEKVTTEAGYDLLIAHSSESARQEASNAKNLFHKRVDGLIASLSLETTNLDHFNPFLKKKVPLIFFDRVEQDQSDNVVIIDNIKAGYIATKHLIEQGCKRIVHITSSLKRNVYANRYAGYLQALKEFNLPFQQEYLIINDLSEKAGVESTLQIINMKSKPDGVFITNDFVAAVCMRTLKEHGFKIPKDIAVVGFNNDAVGNLIEPPLTTINYPGIQIGEIAARNLIDEIQGTKNPNQPNTVIVDSELIIRKSSLKKEALSK